MNSWNDWNKCLDQASAGSVGDPNNSDELKQDCALNADRVVPKKIGKVKIKELS